MRKIDIKTSDGGSVLLFDGLTTGQFTIKVTQLDKNQEPYTAGVQLSNSQGYDLAMGILSNIEVK